LGFVFFLLDQHLIRTDHCNVSATQRCKIAEVLVCSKPKDDEWI